MIIGMDPHKSSNTIAVLARNETMLTRRRFENSDDGFVEMLQAVVGVPVTGERWYGHELRPLARR